MLPKQKGAKYERQNARTPDRETDTRHDREQNKRRGKRGISIISLCFLSLLSFFFFFFFLFSTVFEKRTNFFFQRFFFKRGGFVQITCAISLHLGARALSSDDTLPERERGKDEQHERVLRGKRGWWWWWSWSVRGCKHILPCVSDAVLFSPIAYFAAPSRS